jgi:DNA-binding NarL/FixJ family response regulator
MTPAAPIGIVLAAFDDVYAAGLRELIGRDRSLEILASDIPRRRIAVVLRAQRPDVAILDLAAFSPLAGVRDLCLAFPETRLVLLSTASSAVESAQVLAFGASACLSWGTEARDLLHAIHLAARGVQMMGRSPSGLPKEVIPGQLLTQREAEVLPLLRSGRSNAEIAVELGVGVETVRTHASNLYRKLGVSSRRELWARPEVAAQAPPQEAPHALARARRGEPRRAPRRGHHPHGH